VARICLALDTMIQSPFEDVIPAVQDRLYDILSHNSSVCAYCRRFCHFSYKRNSVHVRRRALLALRALSKEQPDLIKPVIPKVRKRLGDSETAVVSAALIVVTDLIKVNFAVNWRLNGF
jgi:AP-4 complex subunit epsilon-1